jgi:hypothetical protein
MSDVQTTQDLHNKFVLLVKDFATDLVEQGMYESEHDAREAILVTHEDDFLEMYEAELTEAEKHWFWDHRFELNFA